MMILQMSFTKVLILVNVQISSWCPTSWRQGQREVSWVRVTA